MHIYLCDDAPKDHREMHKGESFLAVDLRQKLTEQLYKIHGIPVIRVDRDKGKNESNPKSANLNSCLKKIYGETSTPPEMEVVAVFDADQAAHSNFFTATLPWMDAGDDVAVVQSPQVCCCSSHANNNDHHSSIITIVRIYIITLIVSITLNLQICSQYLVFTC